MRMVARWEKNCLINGKSFVRSMRRVVDKCQILVYFILKYMHLWILIDKINIK